MHTYPQAYILTKRVHEYKCNSTKMAQHSQMFIREMHLKNSDLENKVISSPICN